MAASASGGHGEAQAVGVVAAGGRHVQANSKAAAELRHRIAQLEGRGGGAGRRLPAGALRSPPARDERADSADKRPDRGEPGRGVPHLQAIPQAEAAD